MGKLDDAVRAAQAEAAEAVEVEDGAREARKRAGAEKPGLTVSEDVAVLVLSEDQDLGDIESLLRDRGLDPSDWQVETVRVNTWQQYAGRDKSDDEPRVIDLKQLRVVLRNLRLMIRPVGDVEKRRKPRARAAPSARPRVLAVCGDQHAPYHDALLHEAFCCWLQRIRPDELLMNGDLGDFPNVSRFPTKELWKASTMDCYRGGFQILSDYRDASPGTRRRKLPGNHDDRPTIVMVNANPDLAEVRPVLEGEEAPGMFSLARILHFDKLGIELCGDHREPYDRREIEPLPGVVIRHEPPKGKHDRRVGRALVHGHDHRQGIRHETAYDATGAQYDRTRVAVGAMADTTKGLGYGIDPDWQQGWATITAWPDGALNFELAEWRNGVATWHGRRYS